jgi:DNA-binding transcriptional regulator GbsR (MarR family)
MKSPSPHELNELAEHIGSVIQYWGFKTIHGKIWAHLYTSSEPLDAGSLMKRLGVSKALISMSLKELLKYKVVQMAGRSAEGTQQYEANPEVFNAIIHVLKTREKKMLEKVATGFQALHALNQEERARWHLSSERIDSLRSLIHLGKATLDGFLESTQS